MAVSVYQIDIPIITQSFTVSSDSTFEITEYQNYDSLNCMIQADVANPNVDLSPYNGTDIYIAITIEGEELKRFTRQTATSLWIDLQPGYPNRRLQSVGSTSAIVAEKLSSTRVKVYTTARAQVAGYGSSGHFLTANVRLSLDKLGGKIELIGRHNAIVHYGNNAEHVTRASGGVWYGTGGGSIQKMQLEQGDFGYLWINGQKRRVQLNAQTLGFYK